MKKYLFTVLLFSLIYLVNAQLNIKVTAKTIAVLNNVDCDGFGAGNSDFLFEFNATDNSTFNYGNSNPVTGILGQSNFAFVPENNGPFSISSPNVVFTPTNAVFFDRSYNCVSDFPSSIAISALAYENDAAAPPAIDVALVSGLSNTHTETITINPLSTQTLQTSTFTLTSTSDCIQTYLITFEVELSVGPNVPLYIDEVETTTICPSAANGFAEVHAEGGTGTILYDWSNDGLGDYDDDYFVQNLSAGTIYTLQIKDDLNCVATTTLEIETQNPPTAFTSFSTSTATLCAGTYSVSYSIPFENDLIYNWNYSGSGSITNGNTNSITMDFNNVATSGVLSIYAQNSCSVTPTLTMAITVNAIPSLTVTGNNIICDNSSETLSASGASTYTWSTGDNTPTIAISPTTTTVYTLTGSQNGCTGSEQFTVSTITSPTVQVTTPSASVCVNQTLTLNAIGNGNLFIWSDGIINQTNTINAQASMVYTVTNTYTNSCFAQATYSLHVYSLPAITISGNNETCAGISSTLTASGADDYVWSTSENSPTITYSVINNGTLSVIGTNTLTNCSNTQTIAVSNFTGGLISITGNTLVCPGSTQNYNTSGFDSYVWSNGDMNDFTQLLISGTQTLSVKGTNSIGCSDSTIITIQASAQPTISINGNNEICEGQSVNLSATILGATSFSWSTGETSTSISVTPSSTTIYTIEAFAGLCSTNANHLITVKSTPTVLFPGIRTYCETDPAFELVVSPTGGSFIGIGVTGNNFNPSVGVGEYEVDYTYTAPNGCSASASQTVTIDACVGINEFEKNTSMSIFPNPALNFLNIESANELKSVVITDYTGKIIKQVILNQVTKTTIEIEDLNSGIYFIIVSLNNNSQNIVKIIKQ